MQQQLMVGSETPVKFSSISHASLPNATLGMSCFVDFCYLLMSRSAKDPGRR
jgi:hypothetical protein